VQDFVATRDMAKLPTIQAQATELSTRGQAIAAQLADDSRDDYAKDRAAAEDCQRQLSQVAQSIAGSVPGR
jgi:hypothetical protein